MRYVRYDSDGAVWGVADWPFPGSVGVEDGAVVCVDGVWYDADKAPVKTPEQIQAERNAALQAEFTSAIQQRLDDFARTRGYDNIMSACSYFGSANSRFKQEADRAIALRDATWAAAYALLDDVLSGQRPMPTFDEVCAALPALTWEE